MKVKGGLRSADNLLHIFGTNNDAYLGYSNTDDKFKIGFTSLSNPTVDSNTVFELDASGVDITGDASISGDLVVDGIVTAQEFHTEFVSASIVYQSGSTKFGDTADDIHSFTGSLELTGSLTVSETGSISYITGDKVFIDNTDDDNQIGKLQIGYVSSGRPFLTSYGGGGVYVHDDLILRFSNNNIRASANHSTDLYFYHDRTGDNGFQFVTTDSGSVMRIDGSGNVGIGTNNPGYRFHVDSAGSETVAYFKSSDNRSRILISDDDTNVYVIAENGMASFGRNSNLNANNLNVNSSGDVGVGTSNPTLGRLHVVQDSDAVTNGITIEETSGGNTMRLWMDGSTRKINAGGSNTMMEFDTSKVAFPTGNVGIGTTTPNRTLDVHGSIALQNPSYYLGAYDWMFSQDSGNGRLAVSYYGSEKVSIKDDGKVGIGTDSPTNLLSVAASISTEYSSAGNSNPYNDAVLKLQNTDTSATTPFNLIHFRLDKNGGDGYLGFVAGDAINKEHFIVGNQVDGETFRISSGGKVGIGTTSPSELLHLSSTEPLIRFDDTNSGLHYIVGQDGDQFKFTTNNPTQFSKYIFDARVQFTGYGSGTNTGTAAYTLGVDSSGNIIEIAANNAGEDTDVDTGTSAIETYSSGSASSTFTNYVVYDGTNYRAGQLMSVWDGSGNIQYSDVTTNDIGDTSGVSLFVEINGADIEVKATVPSDNWTVKMSTTLL